MNYLALCVLLALSLNLFGNNNLRDYEQNHSIPLINDFKIDVDLRPTNGTFYAFFDDRPNYRVFVCNNGAVADASETKCVKINSWNVWKRDSRSTQMSMKFSASDILKATQENENFGRLDNLVLHFKAVKKTADQELMGELKVPVLSLKKKIQTQVMKLKNTEVQIALSIKFEPWVKNTNHEWEINPHPLFYRDRVIASIVNKNFPEEELTLGDYVSSELLFFATIGAPYWKHLEKSSLMYRKEFRGSVYPDLEKLKKSKEAKVILGVSEPERYDLILAYYYLRAEDATYYLNMAPLESTVGSYGPGGEGLSYQEKLARQKYQANILKGTVALFNEVASGGLNFIDEFLR